MRELILHCPQVHAEALSDALLQAGALSVSVEDADSDTQHEQPLYGEPGLEPDVQAWQRNRVVVLLPDGLDPEQLLQHSDDLAGSAVREPEWHTRDVPDADWVRVTQAQFQPIPIGERIWIIPSWHRDDPQVPHADAGMGTPDVIRIELDPGLAFGTGSHPTTHLCLAWLESCLPAHSTVLDYGCGSGILAIAARLLGAGDTHAVDIDEQAVQATEFNARVNGVALQAMLPDALMPGQYDVVVANILSGPLKVLAPMLAGRVAPGGHLVLSGILERQADEVAQAYAPWMAMHVWESREGWVCLTGQRPS